MLRLHFKMLTHMSIFLCCLANLLICSSIEVDQVVFTNIIDRLSALEQKAKTQDIIITSLQANRDHDKRGQMTPIEKSRMSKRQVTEGPVAFSTAIKPVTVDHVHTNQAFIFETVLTNFGNGYNKSNGIFTVPLSGIYLLTCSVLDHFAIGNHGNVMLHAEIVRNGDVLARVFAHAEDGYRDQGAQTIIVKVSQGDMIWIRNIDNNDLGLGGQLYTTFSGYLLWQMEA